MTLSALRQRSLDPENLSQWPLIGVDASMPRKRR